MKVYRCENPECNSEYRITFENVYRKWIVRGYKYEYYTYFVKCPKCGRGKEVEFSQLPLSVIWNFIKVWFKNISKSKTGN